MAFFVDKLEFWPDKNKDARPEAGFASLNNALFKEVCYSSTTQRIEQPRDVTVLVDLWVDVFKRTSVI